jgi:hypothetical protein
VCVRTRVCACVKGRGVISRQSINSGVWWTVTVGRPCGVVGAVGLRLVRIGGRGSVIAQGTHPPLRADSRSPARLGPILIASMDQTGRELERPTCLNSGGNAPLPRPTGKRGRLQLGSESGAESGDERAVVEKKQADKKQVPTEVRAAAAVVLWRAVHTDGCATPQEKPGTHKRARTAGKAARLWRRHNRCATPTLSAGRPAHGRWADAGFRVDSGAGGGGDRRDVEPSRPPRLG